MTEAIYIAVTGMKHYFGADFIKIGQVIYLVKEPDNRYDHEAIRAEITPIGKIGYVANSTHTVPKGCRSAGRVYDTFNNHIMGVVRFLFNEIMILEIVPHMKEVYMVWEEEKSSSPRYQF